MPHAHSPLQSDFADVVASCDTVEPSSRDSFSAKDPFRSQMSLPSPPLTAPPTTMNNPFLPSASAKETILANANNDPHNILDWDADHDDIMDPPIKQETSYVNPLSTHPVTTMPESSEYRSPHLNTLHYNDNYNLAYPTPLLSSCPHSYNPEIGFTGLPRDNISPSYPPNAYHIEPTVAVDYSYPVAHGHNMSFGEDYDDFSAFRHDNHALYSSPYDSDVAMSASTSNGDPSLPPQDYRTDCEESPNDRELPYAQLIYRALMGAPNNTMILRDIYEWFKQNTDKAADKETKGWQNSIRHNLSMNGAFEKVDHPCDESRRGFMWRLTDDAKRNGVKSTTRYRSKQPNKRGHRSQNPLPQRQASGAKGGVAARRAAKIRKSARMNNTIYRPDAYRSIPSGAPSIFDAESPYYHDSPTLSDADFDYPRDDYANSLDASSRSALSSSSSSASHFDLFSANSATAMYNTMPALTGAYPPDHTTTTHHFFPGAAHPHHASDAAFLNSPSPDADEPRTPDSYTAATAAMWGPADDLAVGAYPLGMAVDSAYNEYPNGLA